MDPCKPEVKSGAREESASPAWLAAPAMNAHDTTKVYIWKFGILTLNVARHYIHVPVVSVTATTHQEKGIITLESNPSQGTVLPAPHGKGNTNILYNYKLLSLIHTLSREGIQEFFTNCLSLLS